MPVSDTIVGGAIVGALILAVWFGVGFVLRAIGTFTAERRRECEEAQEEADEAFREELLAIMDAEQRDRA